LEERIREKGELVVDVKMFERDKYRTCEDVCDNIESAEEMKYKNWDITKSH
jgi:hypothetical protein